MIKTVKQACRFNPIIRDYRMSQGIENLADLINDAGDGGEFFSRNFVTHGMDQLFREGLLRLSGIAIADGIAFDTGFALKEFAKLAGIELKPGDINQEE